MQIPKILSRRELEDRSRWIDCEAMWQVWHSIRVVKWIGTLLQDTLCRAMVPCI